MDTSSSVEQNIDDEFFKMLYGAKKKCTFSNKLARHGIV